MAVPPLLADAGNIPSYGTLALIVAQWVSGHLKGKMRDRSNERTLTGIQATLTDFVTEQRETNAHLERRIDTVSAHVIGPDGKNGLRSRIEKMEDDNNRRALRPTDVGTLNRPGA